MTLDELAKALYEELCPHGRWETTLPGTQDWYRRAVRFVQERTTMEEQPQRMVPEVSPDAELELERRLMIEEECNRLRKALADSRTHAAALETDIEGWKRNVEVLRDALADEKLGHEKNIRALQDERDRAARLQGSVSALEKARDEQKARADRLARQVDQLIRNQIEEMQAAQDALAKEKARADRAEQKLERAHDRVVDADGIVGRLQTRIAAIEKALEFADNLRAHYAFDNAVDDDPYIRAYDNARAALDATQPKDSAPGAAHDMGAAEGVSPSVAPAGEETGRAFAGPIQFGAGDPRARVVALEADLEQVTRNRDLFRKLQLEAEKVAEDRLKVIKAYVNPASSPTLADCTVAMMVHLTGLIQEAVDRMGGRKDGFAPYTESEESIIKHAKAMLGRVR